MSEQSASPLLNRYQAAEYIGVPLSTFSRVWTKKDELPFTVILKRKYIRASDLEAWLDSKRVR